MNFSLSLFSVALVCLSLTGTAIPAPRDPLDPEAAELVVELVRVAADYDLYSARCRGDVSGRRTDDLKKVLIGKYGITVTQVQDDYFPERSYREASKNLDRAFRQRLSSVGGCKGAKNEGLQDDLRSRYRELMEQLRQLP